MLKNLLILGSGTPTPTPTNFGSAFVLQTGREHLLFDCGPATTHKLAKAGFLPTRISHLFFTHHHFDHNADYPCFLLCRWDQDCDNNNPLTVWGPKPTTLITERLIGEEGAFAVDWMARTQSKASQAVFVERGGKLPRPKPVVRVNEVEPGPVCQISNWKVTAALASHVGPPLVSLAYRVDAGPESIVFAADTVRCPTVMALACRADTLVLSCWDHKDRMSQAVAAVIATTHEAAEMAAEAGVKRLVLTHFCASLLKPGSRERAVAEISRIFKGELIFGEELMNVSLETNLKPA